MGRTPDYTEKLMSYIINKKRLYKLLHPWEYVNLKLEIPTLTDVGSKSASSVKDMGIPEQTDCMRRSLRFWKQNRLFEISPDP